MVMVAVVRSRDTAPLPASPVNSLANRLVPDFAAPASPLQSAVPSSLTTADSKALTENLSRLDSALTKNRGRGGPTSLPLSNSLHLRSLAFLFKSISCALFAQI